MKLSKKIISLLAILPLIFSPIFAFAEDAKEEITEAEQKTTSPIEELAAELPSITDNPSLIITFNDPSTEKEGVFLEIDKKGFQKVKSPYTLPALSIGNHFLKFKFVDKYGSTQIVEKEIIVIPRAPILNTPLIETGRIIFSGSALAGSEVTLLLSADQKMVTQTAEVDEDGKWGIEITDTIPTGMYSFTAFVRKYGYGSNVAQAMTLEVGNGHSKVVEDTGKQKIHFSFKDIDSTNIQEVFSNNTDLIMLLVSSLVLGILFGLLFSTISHKKKENKEIVLASKTLEQPTNDLSKPMTLRDKLISKEVLLEESKTPDPVEEEIEAEPVVINEIKKASKTTKDDKGEKIVTKVDFLKNFKHQDPDNDKGKEKKVKVFLTSKK